MVLGSEVCPMGKKRTPTPMRRGLYIAQWFDADGQRHRIGFRTESEALALRDAKKHEADLNKLARRLGARIRATGNEKRERRRLLRELVEVTRRVAAGKPPVSIVVSGQLRLAA